MQAIRTKYHPATNLTRARVSATAEAGRVILSWNDALDTEKNHDAAALALCRKFDWRGSLAAGTVKGEPGNVYVFCHTDRQSYDGPHVPPNFVGLFRS